MQVQVRGGYMSFWSGFMYCCCRSYGVCCHPRGVSFAGSVDFLALTRRTMPRFFLLLRVSSLLPFLVCGGWWACMLGTLRLQDLWGFFGLSKQLVPRIFALRSNQFFLLVFLDFVGHLWVSVCFALRLA